MTEETHRGALPFAGTPVEPVLSEAEADLASMKAVLQREHPHADFVATGVETTTVIRRRHPLRDDGGGCMRLGCGGSSPGGCDARRLASALDVARAEALLWKQRAESGCCSEPLWREVEEVGARADRAELALVIANAEIKALSGRNDLARRLADANDWIAELQVQLEAARAKAGDEAVAAAVHSLRADDAESALTRVLGMPHEDWCCGKGCAGPGLGFCPPGCENVCRCYLVSVVAAVRPWGIPAFDPDGEF